MTLDLAWLGADPTNDKVDVKIPEVSDISIDSRFSDYTYYSVHMRNGNHYSVTKESYDQLRKFFNLPPNG